jgi:methylglutaconyl-CoA hydratase
VSFIRVGHSNGVARILLDSPANRNALSVQLRTELHAALCEAIADDDLSTIVFGHTGTVFC